MEKKAPSGNAEFERALSRPEHVAFMPGCSLRKVAPDAGDKAFEWLKQQGICEKSFNGCCGQPYALRKDWDRHEWVVASLIDYFKRQKIDTIIAACPNCYYALKRAFATYGNAFEVRALPAILEAYGAQVQAGGALTGAKFTLHDSCPDREEQAFGSALRALMAKLAFVEMAHCQEDALCCGAGSEFIDCCFEEQMEQAELRVQEAKDVDADVIVTACASCTFALTQSSFEREIYHYLELVFGVE